jgi:chemotaxis response regulator CheB
MQTDRIFSACFPGSSYDGAAHSAAQSEAAGRDPRPVRLYTVSYGTQHEEVLPGHVYVAPPDRHLIVSRSGWLGLDAGAKVRHSRPAADRLFKSAAEFYCSRVVGVVLTGGDGDGTDGLRAITEAGGLAIVQDPADAAAPEMPMNALKGSHPDYCLTLNEIGPMLVKLRVQTAHKRSFLRGAGGLLPPLSRPESRICLAA